MTPDEAAAGVHQYLAAFPDDPDAVAFRDACEALTLHANDVGHIPLHQQMVSWGAKSNVDAYQRADGFMLFKWIKFKK